jgi:hypothetical protein
MVRGPKRILGNSSQGASHPYGGDEPFWCIASAPKWDFAINEDRRVPSRRLVSLRTDESAPGGWDGMESALGAPTHSITSQINQELP